MNFATIIIRKGLYIIQTITKVIIGFKSFEWIHVFKRELKREPMII